MLYPKDKLIKITKSENLVIEWRRPLGEGVFIVCIALAFWISMICVSKMPLKDGTERSASEANGLIGVSTLFASPVVYFGLVLLLNRTRIVANQQGVKRTIRPLFVSKDVAVSKEELLQFFVSSFRSNQQTTSSYSQSVYVMDKEQHVQNLAGSLPSPFAAFQIQHELQDYYGLEDLPVYGVTTDPAHPGPR